jgi:hypothetical protein
MATAPQATAAPGAAPGGAPATGQDSLGAPTDAAWRQCLSACLAALLCESGFASATPGAMESLTEATQSFLCELGRSTRAYTELACRNQPLPADVLLATVGMGFSVANMREYAFRHGRRTQPPPTPAVPPKPPAILRTGDRKRHLRATALVPEGMQVSHAISLREFNGLMDQHG